MADTMVGIKKLETTTELFNGQSEIVIFEEVSDYGNISFSDLTKKGTDLGQIVGDSTTWDGEEPSTEVIKDEQGDVITMTTTAGTYSFSCDVASTSKEALVLFMNGDEISSNLTSDSIGVTTSNKKTKGIANVIGIGEDLPVITRPIAIFNDENNRWILFPKAKIVANFSVDGKLWRIHLKVTAEYVYNKTNNLYTLMIGTGSSREEHAAGE